jgi:hypothetical protein
MRGGRFIEYLERFLTRLAAEFKAPKAASLTEVASAAAVFKLGARR